MNLTKNINDIIEPIHISTTFIQKDPRRNFGFEYSRISNPNRSSLEKKLAELEKGRFALVFSSGTAAATTLLATLTSGDHVLCNQDIYEGTIRLLQNVFKKFGVDFNFADFKNNNNLEKLINPHTKLIWMESISNPLLNIANISDITELAKKRNVLTVVDNTFATPIFKNPLKDRVDVVIHSLTKFIAGHHDVTAGALILNNKNLFDKLHFLQHTLGATPSPIDCFLIQRSLESLKIRMHEHQKNAILVTDFLKTNPNIEKVNYPRISGVVSFWIKGNENQTVNILKKFKHIKIAQSLGGPKTIVQHPRSMISFTMADDKLDKIGVTTNLVRMSVGIEEVSLIINDLKQAISV